MTATVLLKPDANIIAYFTFIFYNFIFQQFVPEQQFLLSY